MKNARPHEVETSALDKRNSDSEIVVRRTDGKLVVNSLTIALEFGRRHDNVLRTLNSLIEDGTVNRLNFEEISYTDEMNRLQRAIQLTECGALIAMPFIGGRRSREGQVRLVNAFMGLREQAALRAPLDLSNPATLLALLQTHAGRSLELQQQIAALEPRALALDRLGSADGSMCITDAAKSLKVPPKSLFDWLAQHQWIYRRGESWIGYQVAIMRGLLEHRVTTIHRDDGTEKAATQVRVTTRGVTVLAKKLAEVREAAFASGARTWVDEVAVERHELRKRAA